MTPPRLLTLGEVKLLPKVSSRHRYIRRPAPLVIGGCVVAVACVRGRDPTIDLAAMVADAGAGFFCHVGMRRRVAMVHPAGVELEAGPGDYAPANASGCPAKADGTPADVCAGFARMRAKMAAP